MEPLNNLLRILDALRASGAEKVNFAGGEPFLYPELLGALVRHAKRESGFASVSVISNAARITRAWFEQHGANLDFLGVSCDSVDAQTNHKHGRGPAGAVRAVDRTRDVRAAAALAREFGSRFKVNTVVTDSKFVHSQVEKQCSLSLALSALRMHLHVPRLPTLAFLRGLALLLWSPTTLPPPSSQQGRDVACGACERAQTRPMENIPGAADRRREYGHAGRRRQRGRQRQQR